MRRAFAIAALLAAVCVTLDAYVFLGQVWPDGSIAMQMQLGSSGTLLDGSTSWGQSAESALATWNSYLSRVQFRVVRDSTAPTGDNNGYNNVFFSSSVYGRSFGSSTLAVTTNWYRVSNNARIEADVLFNTAFSWNSYSGATRRSSAGGNLYDLRRVALHEFGHVLGLDHPDEYGQSVAAIMNSRISDTDSLQSDDVAGVRVLYGGGAAPQSSPGPPGNLTTSSSGSSVFLSWTAPSSGGAASAYVIEAGSSSGLSNLANFSTGNTATSFSSGGVGNGTYYIRIKATNSAGTSGASSESRLVVGSGGCTSTPSAPTGFALTSNIGGTVSFAWNAAPGATTYIIEAGSSPGLANLANSDLGSSATSATFNGVGNGTYFVRLRARNACGTSAPSNEVTLIVGISSPGGISETFTGTISGSQTTTCSDTIYILPCRVFTFRVNGSGTLNATLTWAESPDIDLSLWRGSTPIANSRGTTNSESLTAGVSAGDYEWHVTYYGGSGNTNFTLRVTRPN